VRPLRDYVLIVRDPEETTSSGGVVLPDTSATAQALQRPSTGEVIAKGPKVTDEIALGARVTISAYAGVEVPPDKPDDPVWLLAREGEIIAIRD
jgi:chaperonin GroES